MKIYSIIITIVAVCALGLAGYFYWRGGDMRKDFGICQDQRDGLIKDKARLENELNAVNSQLIKISHSAAVLKLALNSFMFAGDIRALTVGSKEAVGVEQAIELLDGNQDRMMAEKDWTDFKTSRYLNPLLGLLRNLANSMERDAKEPGDARNYEPINE
jgi:hypothetical protein